MTMDAGDLHILTGAYAGGALSDEEHAAFVAHLPTCAPCRDEVAELVATAAVLGVAAAEPPPPGFRERVLAEVAATRQLPPAVPTLADARTRRRGRLPRWVLSAAAGVVVVAIALGAWAYSLSRENSDLRHQSDLIAAVQTAPDAKTVNGAVGDATAAVTVARSTGDMVFMASGLPDVGDDRTYQIWLLGPGSSVRSVGTFDGKSHTTRLFSGPGDALAIAVTEEPAGGSERPTTQPVMSMELPRGA
jgi:anti-sigma-K factor RskA